MPAAARPTCSLPAARLQAPSVWRIAHSAACRASQAGSQPTSGGDQVPPPPLPAASPPPGPSQQQQSAPWQLSSYYTKKLERRTDSLGNIISSPETIAAAPGWTPDAQLRLAAEALAPELQQDAEALLEQVRQLQALLPDGKAAVRRLNPVQLIKLATDVEQIGQRLIALRELLPTADVAAIVAAHPPVLRMPVEDLRAAVALVTDAFPEASQEEIDAAVSANGCLLDGGSSLGWLLKGAGHLLTRQQILTSLQRDPGFLYQFQPLEGQSRGERDAEYLADTLRPGT